MKYVIIGNSAAGIGGVEGIRELDKEGEIVLISKEEEFTYSRPLISYYLGGEVDKDQMKYRPDDFYEKNGVTTIFGKAAVGVDSIGKAVTLDDGSAVTYDRLLVATGASPIMPPIPGLENVKEKYTFQSMADALALEKAIGKNKRVLILGGGLIGLKCAEGLTGKVASLTVIDREDHLLPSAIDKESAAYIEAAAKERGVECVLGENVVKISGKKAVCESGREISFDILVVAVGVRPETALLKDAGAVIHNGIVVNRRNETSLNSIYAAGDCVEEKDVVDGKEKVLALLPNAALGGRNAGRNMAGGNAVYEDAVAINALPFWGNHLISAGQTSGECYTEEKNGNFKKLYTEKDHLNGFVLIGDVSGAGIYTALIRNRTNLSEIDFEMIKEKPQLAALTHRFRAEKLGGRTDEN